MPLVQQFQGPGQFTIDLDPKLAAQRELSSVLVEHGQIIVTPQWRPGIEFFDDLEIRQTAKYAGVVLDVDRSGKHFRIHGQGPEWYLGNKDSTPVISTAVDYSDGALLSEVLAQNTAGGILPPAIQVGTITDTDCELFYGAFPQGYAVYQALLDVMAACGAHFRITPAVYIDACAVTRDDVYRVTESAIRVVAVRKGLGGDPEFESVELADAKTRRDARGWASDALIIDELYDGSTAVTQSSTRASNPYSDAHANPLVRAIIADRPSSDAISTGDYLSTAIAETNVATRMWIDSDRFQFDEGLIEVGDRIFVYDPPDFVDESIQKEFRGMTIHPLIIPQLTADIPITGKEGVYYRPNFATTTAEWTDISELLKAEA